MQGLLTKMEFGFIALFHEANKIHKIEIKETFIEGSIRAGKTQNNGS